MRNPNYYVRYTDFGYTDPRKQNKLTFFDWLRIAFLIVCIISIIILVSCVVTTYNELNRMEAEVDSAFANVQYMMNKRMEDIKLMANTVSDIEPQKEIFFENIYFTKADINDAATPCELDAIDTEITKKINSFLVLVEDYPDIKENVDYRIQLDRVRKETRNIMFVKENYNTVVADYNEMLTQFPSSLIARIFNFEPRELFDDL